MTIPRELLETTAASTPVLSVPDEAAVIPLNLPGDIYVVRAEEGSRETLVTQYDLSRARIGGSEVLPAWSDPAIVIETYRLGSLVEAAERILREMFGATACISSTIEIDPESAAPSLVLSLRVPRSLRHLRHEFLGRYARETVITEGAPIPVLQWEYDGAPA